MDKLTQGDVGRRGMNNESQRSTRVTVTCKPRVVYIKKTDLQRHAIIILGYGEMERAGARKTVSRSPLLLLRSMVLDKQPP